MVLVVGGLLVAGAVGLIVSRQRPEGPSATTALPAAAPPRVAAPDPSAPEAAQPNASSSHASSPDASSPGAAPWEVADPTPVPPPPAERETPQKDEPDGTTTSKRTLYDRVLASTAWVLCPTGGNKLDSGTGCVMSRARRLVLTSDHVVEANDQVFVFFPTYQNDELVLQRDHYFKRATRIRGHVVARDRERDLALVELESLPAEARELALASGSPRPSDTIHTVGNPGTSGALWVYTPGTVRAVYAADYTTAEGRYHIHSRVVETNSAINEGDSGGPVVNDQGELVGVNQSHAVNAQLVSKSIDITEIRTFLRPYLPR
jgi:V8-like Glu-specific endopeptidase